MDNLEKLFRSALVLDTETTSLDFKIAEIIEWSAAPVMDVVETVASGEYKVPSQLYKASEPIKPETSAVTSITNKMIDAAANCLFADDFDRIQTELNRHEFYVAHNAFYDSSILLRTGFKLPKQICTMRLAKKLYNTDTTIEKYNLSYLRYALNLPVDDSLVAHRAAADVMVTGMLFVTMIDQLIEEGHVDGNSDRLGDEVVAWLDEPIITTTMPFGKHKGKKLIEVPLDYWQWALESMDSLNEAKPEYDRDFAASVAKAVEEIFEGRS